MSAQCGPGGVTFALGLKARITGGTMRAIGDTLFIDHAREVTVILAAETTFRHADPSHHIQHTIDAAMLKSWGELERSHIADYRALFHRVTFDLNPTEASQHHYPTAERLRRLQQGLSDSGLTSLYFQYGRYLLIACSRPGSLPANLQGLWTDSYTPPWESKYTININTEMNYWPAECCNLSECHLPLFDHLQRMHPNGQKTAQQLYGCGGWVAHHNTNLWGDTAPVDRADCSIWPMGAAWLCLHLWEHYLFTQDREFLKTIAYPLMKDAVLFFLDYLVPHPDGFLRCGPSVSPENTYITPSGIKALITMEATMDRQILEELFRAVIGAAKHLHLDEEFSQKVAHTRDALFPLKVGSKGQLLEWGLS